jgi:hypothetical protein
MMKEAYGGNAVSRTQFENGMQDFGTSVKISKMTKTVHDKQPFEHLT